MRFVLMAGIHIVYHTCCDFSAYRHVFRLRSKYNPINIFISGGYPLICNQTSDP